MTGAAPASVPEAAAVPAPAAVVAAVEVMYHLLKIRSKRSRTGYDGFDLAEPVAELEHVAVLVSAQLGVESVLVMTLETKKGDVGVEIEAEVFELVEVEIK